MLVLSRKVGEKIVIGPNIQVRVVALNGGRVRLGLEVPRDVPIRRSELPVRPAVAPFVNSVPASAELDYSI